MRRVWFEPDDRPFGKDSDDGVFDRATAILVDDPEDIVALASSRITQFPTGQLLGNGVHEFDAAVNIRRNHRVADTLQRRLKPLRRAYWSVMVYFLY